MVPDAVSQALTLQLARSCWSHGRAVRRGAREHLRPPGRGGLLLCLACATLLSSGGPHAVVAADQTPSADVELDPLQPFEPRAPRGERQRDRLDAAALFAHAHLLRLRGEEHEALQQFERAWHYDPDSFAIAQEIIALGSRLGREAEATRYAILAAERHPDLFPALAGLGMIIRQRAPERAIGVLELALQRQPELPRDSQWLAAHIELARLYLVQNQPQRAAERFEVVHRALADPQEFGLLPAAVEDLIRQPAALYEWMAESFLAANRLELAEKTLENLEPLLDDPAPLHVYRARLAAARSDWEDTQSALDEYLASDSQAGSQQALRVLEEVTRATSPNEENAAQRYLEALGQWSVQRPQDAVLRYLYAEKLAAAGQRAEAAQQYETALQAEPTQSGYAALSGLYLTQRDATALLKTLADLLEKTGSLAAVEDQLASRPPHDPLFEQVWEQALAQSEALPRFAATLAAIELGAIERAEALLTAALQVPSPSPRHDLIRQVGVAFLLAGEAVRAAQALERALAEAPAGDQRMKAIDYYYLAGAYAQNKQISEALAAAEQAAALGDGPRFQSRPAWIMYYSRRLDDAHRRYLQLLEKYDSDYQSDDVRQVLRDARLILSNVAVLQDRLPEAEEWLEQVLDEFPEDSGALNDLGYLWADQGKRLQRSLEMVQKAVEAEPDNVAYRDSLGWAYYQLGQFEEAVAELEKAAAGDDPDGVILDHLGDAYLEAGQPDKALQAWQRALAAFEREAHDNRDKQLLEKTKIKVSQRLNAVPD